MKTATKFGLGLGMLALLGAAVGCGAGAESGHAATVAPAGGNPAYGAPEPAADSDRGASPSEASPPPPAPPAAALGGASRGEAKKSFEPSAPRAEAAPVDRPGLGTEWGETRFSRIDTVAFSRAEPASPFATAGVFYNDEIGARAMASSNGFHRTSSSPIGVAGNAVTIALRDEGGRFLSGFAANGKSFIVGEAGQRYTIVVHNNTDLRFEVVLSVDGLDVMDGKESSFRKRGYIIDPHGEVDVDGFRQSTETVAAFRFGSVRNSYAGQKHGDTRNVGIIGVALFNERGTNPFPWTSGEIQRREQANPFPGQFASPP